MCSSAMALLKNLMIGIFKLATVMPWCHEHAMRSYFGKALSELLRGNVRDFCDRLQAALCLTMRWSSQPKGRVLAAGLGLRQG